MRLLKAGALYFALVFAAGFVLGTIRVPWLVPRVGERIAELVEAPIMLVVMVLAARWVARRLVAPRTPARLLAVGSIALGLLLLAELTLVLGFRGLTLAEYVAGRDPVAGTVYAVMLGLFALMPAIVATKGDAHGT